MVRISSLFSTLLLALAGCSATGISGGGADAMLEGVEVSVVTARDALPGRGPVGITDRFTLEGRMVAFATLRWPENHVVWGEQRFESRWYHRDAQGEHLVKKVETPFTIVRSPYFITSTLLPVALGIGAGRYEILAGGRKLAEHTFDIVEPQMSPKAPARAVLPMGT